ncbi:MAG: hypothetical protein LQ346_006661 [Caloplaca aetnensis]|nr:MAG: hypothetical protein LQ346_006661 [Caloplaca aetnensis]
MPLVTGIDPERTLIPLLSRCCTAVNVSDLRDRTDCPICTRDFGWKAGSERPVQLPCGHIVGRHCIREWVRISWPAVATCPECRRDFLGIGPGLDAGPERPGPRPGQQRDATPSPSSDASDGEQSRRETGPRHASGLFAQAIERHRQAPSAPAGEHVSSRVTRSGRSARPRAPRNANRSLSPEQKEWMRRTELLWIAVYDAVLNTADDQNARILPRYSSIYYMYGNFKYASRGTVEQTVDDIAVLGRQVPVAWSALMEHMDGASNIGIDDVALDGFETIPPHYRRRLEERRDQLRARLPRDNDIF